MIHFNEIKLWNEPYNWVMQTLKDIPPAEPEMSAFDSEFLCGVLQKFKPGKLLEVGVAAGGTTAIILKALTMLSIEKFECYSIDINERYYRDESFGCGFLGEQARSILGKEFSFHHRFLYGEPACSYMEAIGGEVDCLILDTVHSIPGEILDMITLLPYMRDGGIVILHDTAIQFYGSKNEFSNTALIGAVTGEKYYNFDDEKKEGISNIGAFVVGKDTMDNVCNLFQMLLIPWSYVPEQKELECYKRTIESKYSSDEIVFFNKILSLQNCR